MSPKGFGIVRVARVWQIGRLAGDTRPRALSEGQLRTFVGDGLPRKSAFSAAIRASSQPIRLIGKPSTGSPSAGQRRAPGAFGQRRQAEGLPARVLDHCFDQFHAPALA